MLEPLLGRLCCFAPHHIVVEPIPSSVLQKFVGKRLKIGGQVQQELGLSTFQAEQTLRREKPKGAQLILLPLVRELGLWRIEYMDGHSDSDFDYPYPLRDRALVVVGSSHKPFLERHLKPLADLQLVQLRDLK